MNWVGVGRVGVVGEIDFWSGQEWWSSYSDPFDLNNTTITPQGELKLLKNYPRQ